MIKKIRVLTYLLLFAVIALCATACATTRTIIEGPSSAPLAQTATPLPEKVVDVLPAPSEAAAQPDGAWQTITPPGESFNFELPVSWSHYGQDTNWSPDEGETMIGLRQGWNRPGQAVEDGLLPEDANLLEAENEMINNISVRRFRIETRPPAPNLPEGQEPPMVYETHLIFVRADSMVVDFFLRAPSEAEMDELYPVLVHAVESAKMP